MSVPINPLLDAALRYADSGWKIFPLHGIERGACTCRKPGCTDQGKHPRLANGFLGATTDPDQIRRWWEMWPNANIGIATGVESGIWVLDIDNKQSVEIGPAMVGLGDNSLEVMQREAGQVLPDTATVQTGGGGIHLYFQATPDDDVRNRGAIYPGIDVRGIGGYVVAPPSSHISGYNYVWMEDGVTPTAAPEWLVQKTKSPKVEVPDVENFLNPLPEGSRNQSLHDIGAAYRRSHPFNEYELYGLLMAHNVHRCVPPLDPGEVSQIAKNVASYATEATLDVDEWNNDLKKQENKSPPPEIPEGGDLAITIRDLMMNPPTPPPPLVFNADGRVMMHAGTGIIMAGPPNVGKTWVMMDLMLSITTGTKWLGTYQCEQGPVLFVDEEGHPYGDHERFKKLYAGRGMAESEDLSLRLSLGSGIRLDTEVGLTRFRRMLERYAPRLVVLDSLVRFSSGDENDARGMANFFDITKKLMRAYDTAFCFTHHVRKPSLMDDGDVGNIMRGTSEIRAWPDWIGVLTPGDDNQQAILHNVKQRWGQRFDDPLEVRIQIDDDDGTARLGVEGIREKKERTASGTQNRILKAIEDLSDANEYTTIDAITGQVGAAERTVRTYLSKLVAAGVIETVVGAAMFGKPKTQKAIYRIV